MGAFDELIDILSESIEFEVDNVTEAELRVRTVDCLTANSVEPLPVTGLHELGMELLDQRSDCVHLLDTVVQSEESLVVLDIFVLGEEWLGLVLFHVLKEHLKVISIDGIPESLFPRLELSIDDGDKIPKLLELDELVLAVIKFLLLGSLELE